MGYGKAILDISLENLRTNIFSQYEFLKSQHICKDRRKGIFIWVIKGTTIKYPLTDTATRFGIFFLTNKTIEEKNDPPAEYGT